MFTSGHLSFTVKIHLLIIDSYSMSNEGYESATTYDRLYMFFHNINNIFATYVILFTL